MSLIGFSNNQVQRPNFGITVAETSLISIREDVKARISIPKVRIRHVRLRQHWSVSLEHSGKAANIDICSSISVSWAP